MEDGDIKDYREMLSEQSKWLDSLLTKTEKSLKANKTKGDIALRFSKRNGQYQYYLEDGTGKRQYIKKKDVDMAARVAQRDYDLALKKTLTSLRYRLNQFINLYDIGMVEAEYDNLSEARKRLIVPVVDTDSDYITKWMTEHRGGMNPYPREGQYLTERGELVRSKSEKILADLFNRHSIPYVYETEFELDNGYYIYPDFALLNVKERRTIYWEHFGLASDGEYSTKALQKLRQYESAGIEVGVDLLFSVEAENMPLDVKSIEKKIMKYLI